MQSTVIDPDFRNHVKSALSLIASQEIPNNLASKQYVGNLVSNTVTASSTATTTNENSYRFLLVDLPTSNNAYLIEANLLSTDTLNPGTIMSWKIIITAYNTGNGVVIVNFTKTPLATENPWDMSIETIGNGVYVDSLEQDPVSVSWTFAITPILGTPTPFVVRPPQ